MKLLVSAMKTRSSSPRLGDHSSQHAISPSLLLFGAVPAALLWFTALASGVAQGMLFPFDRPLLLFLHGYASPVLDHGMAWVSLIGSVWLLAPLSLLVFLVLLRHDRRRHAVYWLLAMGGAGLLNVLAKHGIKRLRPELWPRAHPESLYSFPSGHAMATMAALLALMVVYRARRAAWPLALAGALYVAAVGLSRLYLGAHFPSDVLAGWSLSFAWCVGLAGAMGLVSPWHAQAWSADTR